MKYILFIYLIAYFSSLISGYFIHESTHKDARLIPVLRVQHDPVEEKFPNNFTIDIDDLEGNNITERLMFVKVLRTDHDHPIASGDVYTNSNSDVVRVTNLKNDFETYRQIDGRGYATLIRNVDVLSSSDHKYRMLGSIHSIDKRTTYDIYPTNTASQRLLNKRRVYNSQRNTHYIAKRETKNAPCASDSRKFARKIDQLVQTKRSQRAVNGQPITLYVEQLLCADKTLYDYHQKILQSTDKSFVFEMMRIYYSHFFTQVNENYATSLANDPDLRVVIKLKNFIFYTEPTEWTDNKKNGIPGYPTWYDMEVLSFSKVLDNFGEYLEKNPVSFTYDLAVSMFRKDIWEGSTPQGAGVLGAANGKGACNSTKRYYIMEEIGNFFYVTTASHEIGHTLGVDHDENYPDCKSDSGYVMAAGMIPYGAPNPNYGRFTKCSINALKKTLLKDDLSGVRDDFKCLENTPSGEMSDVTNQLLNSEDACKVYNGNKNSAYCNLPGQVMSPDEQCKWMHGPEHQFYSDNANTSCEYLSCLNTNTKYFRSLFPALEGTQCGSGKVCLSKKCVENKEISNTDLICPFEDPKINIQGFQIPDMQDALIDCESYLTTYYSKYSTAPIYGCVNDNIKSSCCRACKKYQDYTCFDAPACSMYSEDPDYFCKSYDYIKKGCPKLCKTCSSSTVTCKDDTYLCQNGGKCVNDSSNPVLGYKCQCPTGFKGFLCETPDPCATNPCPTGTCKTVGSLNKFICV